MTRCGGETSLGVWRDACFAFKVKLLAKIRSENVCTCSTVGCLAANLCSRAAKWLLCPSKIWVWFVSCIFFGTAEFELPTDVDVQLSHRSCLRPHCSFVLCHTQIDHDAHGRSTWKCDNVKVTCSRTMARGTSSAVKWFSDGEGHEDLPGPRKLGPFSNSGAPSRKPSWS